MHVLKKITQEEFDKSDDDMKEFLKEEVAIQEDIINEMARLSTVIINAHPENHPQQMLASILSAGAQFIIKSAYVAAIPKDVMTEMFNQIIEEAYKDEKHREEIIKEVKKHLEDIAKKATKH